MNIILTNPWVFMTCFIWAISGLVCTFRKDYDGLGYACLMTIAMGFGYMFSYYHH
jgi:hypothetical protein